MHPRAAALSLFCFLPFLLATQAETRRTLEDVLPEDAAVDGDMDFEEAYVLLDGYRRRPLDLNQATAEQLAATYLLTPLQTDAILSYRDRLGKFTAVYELQAVPGLDLETVRKLLPFVTVGKGLDDVSVPLSTLLTKGRREFFLRAGRKLETSRGYDGAYVGDPTRTYLKYRYRYGNQLSLGLVMEKDPGESYRQGPDYTSVHFFVRRLNPRVLSLALGDFRVSFGQGLVLHSGFGYGKSSLTTSVARIAPTLQPYAGVTESNFMRGAGVTVELGRKLESTVFVSRLKRTGNLSADSTHVTSLNTSGLHRTTYERDDRHILTQFSYGGNLRYRPSSSLRLSVNFLGERLSLPLEPRPRPYNLYYFRGRQLHNLSIDYRYRVRNFTFFGEVAGALSAGKAMLLGANIGLSRKADLALVYRDYDRDYQALGARPFAETSGGRNERGVYLGLEVRPSVHWQINAYYDIWKHDYLRYRVDGPSDGREYRLRITHRQKRKLETYLELRGETKGIGVAAAEEPIDDPVVDRTRFQFRFHYAYHISKAMEWRTRLDVGYTDDLSRGLRTGASVLQEIHYRPLGPFAFSFRLAYFDTDGYDVRFYQYENGLTYNARVLPYYHHGGKSFLLLRYKGIRNLTLEARIARTNYFDDNTFGSGHESTGKHYRTEVGGQVIWRW